MNGYLKRKDKKMKTVYYEEEAPINFEKSLFLLGPTPRSYDVESWWPRALEILSSRKYDGIVFVPEYRNGTMHNPHFNPILWEDFNLNISDVKCFYIPRNMANMPGLTTNIEWGRWENCCSVVLGSPRNAVRMGYIKHYANTFGIPVFETIEETIDESLKRLNKSSIRIGGERMIPLTIWNTEFFQIWYREQKSLGNTIISARVRYIRQSKSAGANNEYPITTWLIQVCIMENKDQVLSDKLIMSNTETSIDVDII